MRGNAWSRADLPAFLGGPVVRSGAAVLLICSLSFGLPSRAHGETITRRHLDAGRVEFSGLDINGDGIPDVIAQDNINKSITYFLVDQKQSLKRIVPLDLPEDDRFLIPDVLSEQDLDGDEVRDLLIYNRGYLMKYVGNDAVYTRLLGSAIFIGQAKDTYRNLSSCSLTPEARKAIVDKAREAILRDPR